MVKGTVKVKAGIDRMADIKKQLVSLAKKEVLVGIPQAENTRDDAGEINNAELLYIQTHGVRQQAMRDEMRENIDKGMKYSAAHSLYVKEHGSPLWQIPPRPVLEPAIEDSKDKISQHLKKVSIAALAGDSAMANTELNKAGMIGATAAREWFENPKNDWPENSDKTKKSKGSDQPLIDTGAMRQAITYVIRDRE